MSRFKKFSSAWVSLSSNQFTESPWRWMFAIAGIMALSVWMLRKNMPESARWLESVGRSDEADRIVSNIEVEAGMQRPKPLEHIEIVLEGALDVRELFRSALLGRTLIRILLAIVVLTGNYGFIAWIPTFLVKQGQNVFSSLCISTLMAVGSICGPLLGLWISDNLGRRYRAHGLNKESGAPSAPLYQPSMSPER